MNSHSPMRLLSRPPSFPYYKSRVTDQLVQSVVRSMGIASVVTMATTHYYKWQQAGGGYIYCVSASCVSQLSLNAL